jgi:hypothetical protein
MTVSFSSYRRKDKTQNKFGTLASIKPPQVPNFGLFFFKGLVNLIFLGTKKNLLMSPDFKQKISEIAIYRQ